MKKALLTFCIILIGFTAVAQKNSLIRPGEIWPDTEGKHINAHGGKILLHQGTYYWFGEIRLPRGETDRTNYGAGCYSSSDPLNCYKVVR